RHELSTLDHLLDIWVIFENQNTDRLFTRDLLDGLNCRPRAESLKAKQQTTDLWLAQQLHPFGIKPRTLWIGDTQGYYKSDFLDTCRRYISKSDLDAPNAEAS